MFSSHEGIEPESIACAVRPLVTDSETRADGKIRRY